MILLSGDPLLAGRANFGFVSRYDKGARTPSGSTVFQFQAGELTFESTAYDWLVVSGSRAQFKGVGAVNGTDGYGFLLSAVDGDRRGGDGTDRFRIKIWDAAGAIVYDNQLGADDGAAATTAIAGGSIQIQPKSSAR
jgi:hypothetical protein